jgi:hypothetical protein
MISCGLLNVISAQVRTIRHLPPLQAEFSLQVAPKPPCDARKMREIRAPATADSSSVTINCSCTLDSGEVITKQFIFEGTEANYVIFDGRGALLERSDGTVYAGKDMIEVKSFSSFSNGVRTWQRPVHVTIKNLRVTGSIRIWGMATNGQGLVYDDDGRQVNHYKNSSFKKGHTERARANAPAYITLEHMTITGTGRNPVYFAPGVSYSKLLNSTLLGYSDAVAVYLDAESTRNTIKDNQFHIETRNYPYERWDRPLIAIDGSSYDTISNNYLSALNHGGIYLYRNCGENGVVRHSTPSHNQIINNIFPYNKYDGDNPGVYLSSKNDDFTLTGFGFGFCDDDDGYPFGSSASNLDYARYNVVMQNQILKRSVSDVIVTKNPDVNYPNYVKFNTTVTTAVDRPCGCYVGSRGFKKDFIEDGQSVEALQVSPDFRSFNYTCRNGTLIKTGENSAVTRLAFDCKISDDNRGFEKTISCPDGQTIIGATAAANLEFGDITDAMMDLVPTNMIQVLKTSDHTDDGVAFIGSLRLSSFEKIIDNVDGKQAVRIGCQENDANGGDCHIRVYLYCRQF